MRSLIASLAATVLARQDSKRLDRHHQADAAEEYVGPVTQQCRTRAGWSR